MPRDPDGRTVLTDPETLNSCNRPVVWARWASGAFHTGYELDRSLAPPAAQDHQDPRALPHRGRRRKLIYLAIQKAEAKWQRVFHWPAAFAAFKIEFGDRIPDNAT